MPAPSFSSHHPAGGLTQTFCLCAQEQEVEREKQLILEGKLPVDRASKELLKHPVFKVSQMTRRIIQGKRRKASIMCYSHHYLHVQYVISWGESTTPDTPAISIQCGSTGSLWVNVSEQFNITCYRWSPSRRLSLHCSTRGKRTRRPRQSWNWRQADRMSADPPRTTRATCSVRRSTSASSTSPPS